MTRSKFGIRGGWRSSGGFRKLVAGALAAGEVLENRACLAAGGFDGSFGLAGKELAGFAAGWKETAVATAIDAQGRTLVAGTLDFGMGKDFAVFRFLPNGAPDTTFAGTGHRYVTFNLGGGNNDVASAIAVDSQGRIVVAGTADTSAQGKDLAICRLTSTGLLDPTFDTDGKTSLGFDLGGTNDDNCNAMMIDTHGRIVAAAGVNQSSASVFGVARLDDAGHLDPAFDGDGKAIVSFSTTLPAIAVPTGIACDSLGRLVVSGTVARWVGKPAHFVLYGGVARLLPQGAPDAAFASLGKRLIASDQAGQALAFGGVAIDAVDRPVLVGTRGTRLSIVRLRTDGKPDGTFGVAGRTTVRFAFAPGVPGSAVPITASGRTRVGIDPAGRIVVAATVAGLPNMVDVGVIRLTKKGLVDATFDGDGRVPVTFNAGGNDQDFFGDLAIDAQGRITVCATIDRDLQGNTDIGVARLLS